LSLSVLYVLQFFKVSLSAQNKVLEIKTGMSFDEVADELKTENFIQSKTILKIYTLILGQTRQFKPGRYILSVNLSIPELVKILTKGPAEISVTIVPGMTIKEIDEKLSELTIIEPDSLVNLEPVSLKEDYPWLNEAQTLEGFLLPDTYNFFVGSDGGLVARKFLDNFESKALPFFANSSNILRTINLASLLEKEIPDAGEQQIAAGVLLKRLGAGMPLQVDAALIYGKCFGRFLGCPSLQEKDFKLDSPYNTYLHIGLPKTPICNPGLTTIEAALNPQKSAYWYYLSDPQTKKTIFSKTLDEHNTNRAKYLF
jgi:UPF0755 protein